MYCEKVLRNHFLYIKLFYQHIPFNMMFLVTFHRMFHLICQYNI